MDRDPFADLIPGHGRAPPPSGENSDNPFADLIPKPKDEIKEPFDPRALRALGQGLTVGFGDEGEAFLRSQIYGTSYDDELAETRKKVKSFQELHPTEAASLELAGAALPILATGGGAAPATIGGAVGRGALTGAAYGGLYGFGTGEGLEDRAKGSATGAVVGGTVGAAAPLAVAGGTAAVRPAMRFVRGAYNPEAEAGRRVAQSIQRDQQAGGVALNPADDIYGQPTTNIERGGETTRALARTAANASPEARATLDRTINTRFEGQGDRVTHFVRGLVGGTNAAATREGLQTAAQRANRPAYARAYQAGNRGIWSPELERLAGSPDVLGAMQAAAITGKSRAINEGFGAFNPGVRVTPDGRVLFQRGPKGVPTYPNLQYWDYVKRELDGAANRASRAGDREAASRLRGQANLLRDELDRHVPAYAQARAGAAAYFGAQDALEAGENFLSRRVDWREAIRNVNNMNPAERQLFREGFTDSLIRKVEATRDRSNVVNQIFGSHDARTRMRIALGPQRTAELEAYLRVEAAMDLARTAVQGNSTTARQLVEMGIVGFGSNLLTGEPYSARGLVVGLLYGAARRGGRAITSGVDARVAGRVADMLVSNDPAVYQQGIRIIARNPAAMRRLRDIGAIGGAGAAQQATGE